MRKRRKKSKTIVGMPPGTLVHVGEKKTEKARITVIDYDRDHIYEEEIDNIEKCKPYRYTETVTWINIDGIHDTSIIEKIGGQFQLHPLVLEDILNTEQRPKIDDLEDTLFIVLKMLSYGDSDNRLEVEQLSLVLGPNFVISFQEREGDFFEPIRERLRNSKGRIRSMGPDYLAYALIDAVVDHYFIVLEKFGEDIEFLEDELIADPRPETLSAIHNLKNDLIFLRKSVWPLREVVGSLGRGESDLIAEKTLVFIRDVYDHTVQIIDTIETYRDMASGIQDLYLSSLSNKMNEVMKVLTIIATIFMPLSFIVGWYGMNFEYMPELKWHFGYPLVLVVMAVIATGMIIYFKNNKWL